MPTFTIRPLAALDLEGIRAYIAENNPAAALQTIDEIEARFEYLAQFPLMGEAHPELVPELRMFSVGNYLVFYFPREYGVEIVRVLHRRRNIRAMFER